VPEHVTTLIRAGKLAPTEDYIAIVLPYLSKEEFSNKPLILSSVGRWHGEEDGVLGAAEASGHPVKAVVYLDITEEGVRTRWQEKNHVGARGERHDDTEEILETRLEEYREKTLPVIDYYKKSGLLIDIDSSLPKDVVLQTIIDELYKRAIA
jgi:adenylate kinase